MRNILSKRKSGASAPRPHLDSVWYVDADESYRVERIPGSTRPGLVAVRTLSGSGWLELENGQTFSLKAGTLAFFRDNGILRYAAGSGGWQFYWFVYDLPAQEQPEEGCVRSVPCTAMESAAMERCFMNLDSSSDSECALAEALFGALLAQWRAGASDRSRAHREILDLLGKGRRERLSVAELAREAGMSERSFRSAVCRITGLPPKEFMLRAEMDAAMELLRTSDMSVSEIADSFGYANAFYFSRVFRKHFGFPPSQVRVRRL